MVTPRGIQTWDPTVSNLTARPGSYPYSLSFVQRILFRICNDIKKLVTPVLTIIICNWHFQKVIKWNKISRPVVKASTKLALVREKKIKPLLFWVRLSSSAPYEMEICSYTFVDPQTVSLQQLQFGGVRLDNNNNDDDNNNNNRISVEVKKWRKKLFSIAGRAIKGLSWIVFTKQAVRHNTF